ncbi:MAG: prefoldin subunit alpha [Halobacteriota archaeon]
MANEQEIKVLVAQLQQYEAEAQAYEQQLNVINFTINEIDNAIQSIDALSNPEAGADTLIPIGASSFVYGTIPETKRVVVGLGSTISAEVAAGDAKKYLSERKDKLNDMRNQFGAKLRDIGMQIFAIQSRLQAVAR